MFQENAAAVNHNRNNHSTEQGGQKKIQGLWTSDDSENQGRTVEKQNKNNADQGKYAPYIHDKPPSFRI